MPQRAAVQDIAEKVKQVVPRSVERKLKAEKKGAESSILLPTN
jgi:hypothetical protein